MEANEIVFLVYFLLSFFGMMWLAFDNKDLREKQERIDLATNKQTKNEKTKINGPQLFVTNLTNGTTIYSTGYQQYSGKFVFYNCVMIKDNQQIEDDAFSKEYNEILQIRERFSRNIIYGRKRTREREKIMYAINEKLEVYDETTNEQIDKIVKILGIGE